MSLALVSAASRDELEALARKIFGPAYSPDGGAILPTVMDTGGGVLAVSWLLFVYVIFDRWRYVKNNPYTTA